MGRTVQMPRRVLRQCLLFALYLSLNAVSHHHPDSYAVVSFFVAVPDGVVRPQSDPLRDRAILLLRSGELLLRTERLVGLRPDSSALAVSRVWYDTYRHLDGCRRWPWMFLCRLGTVVMSLAVANSKTRLWRCLAWQSGSGSTRFRFPGDPPTRPGHVQATMRWLSGNIGMPICSYMYLRCTP